MRLPDALVVVLTLGLALWTTRSVFEQAGELAVPLDDTYIHFQYARSFLELSPLSYSEGAPKAAGATSLLWPALLAIASLLGFKGQALIWPAWALGWTALALMAIEARKLARGVLSPGAAIFASLLVLAFGGHVWFAASGMEVLPLGWLLTRTLRRAAEYQEGRDRVSPHELVALAWLGPLLRPEGALASLAVGVTVLAYARGRSRHLGWAALAAPLGPGLINWALTGDFAQTTAQAKWLPLNPYYSGSALVSAIWSNVALFFGTLLNGELWSRAFIPEGSRPVALLALPVLLVAGIRRGAWYRATLTVALGLAILIPATYESFLVNRLRYLWPFTVPWLIGLAAIADLAAEGLARIRPELVHVRWVALSAFVVLLGRLLPVAVHDVAESAAAISAQQVSLGHWARDTVPKRELIGVNDTGAIAYVSGQRVFDVVGLTTRGEARYWVAGAGSRFEHYERLGRSKLPHWFIVYPEWFAVAPLLGECPTERYVPGATILGGERMVACRADYTLLGSGKAPAELAAEGKLIDELDVADLESERAHAYVLGSATQAENVVVSGIARVDGARSSRTQEEFDFVLAPGALLIARLGAESPLSLELFANDRRLGTIELVASSWQEVRLRLPSSLQLRSQRVKISAKPEQRFSAMHYWLYSAE